MNELQQQDRALNDFLTLVTVTKSMPQEMAETCIHNPLLEIYKSLSRTLKESNIPNPDEADQDLKYITIVNSLTQIQNQLIHRQSQFSLKSCLDKATNDIKSAVGGSLSEEFSNVLNTLNGNFVEIENYFTTLTDRINDLETNVISTVRQEF